MNAHTRGQYLIFISDSSFIQPVIPKCIKGYKKTSIGITHHFIFTPFVPDPSPSLRRITAPELYAAKKLLCIRKTHHISPIFMTSLYALCRIVNNYDWYKKLNVVDFLRVAGRSFRMGTMLSRSSVQSRLNSEDGMSLTEFTYQVCEVEFALHLYLLFFLLFLLLISLPLPLLLPCLH